jgi:hypothetical protein
MVKLLIKLQSTSDIITNSSSEVFLCYNQTDFTIKELIDFIELFHREHQLTDWDAFRKLSKEEQAHYDHSSGCGGDFSIYTYEESKGTWVEYEFEGLKDPENYIVVDTDWCHRATINWLIDNLNAKCIS